MVPSAHTRIYVIRHGETTANRDGILQGQQDHPLTEEGVQMAARVGAALADVRFDAAFSSPLSRAAQTARTVLDASGNSGVPVCTDDRLLELHMGAAQGFRFRGNDAQAQTDPEHRERVQEYIRAFREMPADFPGFPGGESRAALCARTQDFLRELAESLASARNEGSRTVLVSTHGCALRAMLNNLYENPADFWHGKVSPNCAVSIVEVGNDARLTIVGDDLILY